MLRPRAPFARYARRRAGYSRAVGEKTAEKIARNNSLFRDANNDIEAAAAGFGIAPGRWTPFICECSDPQCMQIVRVTLDEYRHVRSDPRWFVHAIGHETEVEGAVRPVEEHDRFVIVEKIGEAGSIAAELAGERTET
jgi:hypothetical protein